MLSSGLLMPIKCLSEKCGKSYSKCQLIVNRKMVIYAVASIRSPNLPYRIDDVGYSNAVFFSAEKKVCSYRSLLRWIICIDRYRLNELLWQMAVIPSIFPSETVRIIITVQNNAMLEQQVRNQKIYKFFNQIT